MKTFSELNRQLKLQESTVKLQPTNMIHKKIDPKWIERGAISSGVLKQKDYIESIIVNKFDEEDTVVGVIVTIKKVKDELRYGVIEFHGTNNKRLSFNRPKAVTDLAAGERFAGRGESLDKEALGRNSEFLKAKMK